MKKFTPVITLGILAAASLPSAAQATFEKSGTDFWTTHRTAAIMADFTNNDHLDIFYGGQGNNRFNDPVGWWWQIQQNFCINNGDGTFTIDGYNYAEREYTDEEGQTKTAYDRVWSNHGVMGSTYNQYAAIDYNNDGLLDLLLFGRSEWDIFLTDEEKSLDRYLLLYKNLGEGKFELVTEAAFPKMKPDNNSKNFSLAVGDYDRDGFVDFVVSATDVEVEENHPGRTVSLYRNLNGTGAFKDMKIAETKGGVYTNEKKDDSGNIIVEKKLLEGYFLPVSGDVHFADLDNDGWLDIVVTGWADNNWDGVHSAGNTGKIYLNKNGEKFVDATPDTPGFVTLRSSASSIADFDKDGNLDLFQTGWGDNGYNWNAFLFYNNADGKTFFEEPLTCDALGLDGTEGCRQQVRDFDNDGNLDIYYSGATGCQLYYGNIMGSFTKGEGMPSYSDGYAAVGDINKNGLSDIFMVGYTNDGAMAQLQLNTTDKATAPEAPKNVKATITDNRLNITWEYDTDAAIDESLVYNIFVKKPDGSIYTLVAANPETGFVKTGYGRTTALRPQIKEYSIPAENNGQYTVGVQAISTANETYSEFTKATVGTSAIEAIGDDNENAPVRYYNTQGIRIDKPVKGQLVIKVQGTKASKLIY